MPRGREELFWLAALLVALVLVALLAKPFLRSPQRR